MERDLLIKILSYIDEHIEQKLELKELAEIAGYSPFYFSRLFSEAMGMPVTGYIRIRKLQYAVVSLQEGRKVLDVALMYAFDSHEGFTRAFTQFFGSTPSTVKRYLVSYTVPGPVVPDIENRRNDMEWMEQNNRQQDMHQLVFAVLEEALEEAREGFCTQIEIELLWGNKIRIADNGRGIPLSEDLCLSREVLDKILAGRPVTNLEYSQMGDLKKAGMQAVNSLCEELQVTVKKDKLRFRQDYIRGIPQHEMYVSEGDCGFGTEIILKPDSVIFPRAVFLEEVIQGWVKEQAAGMENVEIRIKTSQS